MENDATEATKVKDLVTQEMALEAERRLREQQTQQLNLMGQVINLGIKLLSEKSLVFFAVFCVLFLFGWVMAAPDVLRVISASLASVGIWFIVKVDCKGTDHEK